MEGPFNVPFLALLAVVAALASCLWHGANTHLGAAIANALIALNTGETIVGLARTPDNAKGPGSRFGQALGSDLLENELTTQDFHHELFEMR